VQDATCSRQDLDETQKEQQQKKQDLLNQQSVLQTQKDQKAQ
jgi:hypothetical protein